MKNKLDKLSTAELGELFPIIIEKHNPEWIKIFETEKKKILDTFEEEPIIRIEHIGLQTCSQNQR